jgi:hypothetical protein
MINYVNIYIFLGKPNNDPNHPDYTPLVVQRSRQLSSVRIHVERAIERIKDYCILSNTMPLTMMDQASDIVKICAALTNLSPRLMKDK